MLFYALCNKSLFQRNNMKLIRTAFVAMSGLSLVACGGNKNVAPATNPSPEVSPAKKVVLNDAVDRYSYALGMDLGKAIANINVPLKMDVLMSAIEDEVDTSRVVLMTDSASEVALQDMLSKMQEKKALEEKALAEASLKAEAEFLAKNIQDSTVKVTTKGVQYKVVKEGAGISPKANDKVQVHYAGSLMDGTEFDNSIKRGEPLEFPVNAVIEGWQDLLQVMHEGEKVKAWIPSALAYGEAGVPPMIPANALLVFEVELLKVYAEVPPALPATDSVKSDSSAVPADTAKAVDTATAAAEKADAPADSAKAVDAASPAAEPSTSAAPAEAPKTGTQAPGDGAKKAAKGAAKAAKAAEPAKSAPASNPAPAAKSAPAAQPAKK